MPTHMWSQAPKIENRWVTGLGFPSLLCLRIHKNIKHVLPYKGDIGAIICVCVCVCFFCWGGGGKGASEILKQIGV